MPQSIKAFINNTNTINQPFNMISLPEKITSITSFSHSNTANKRNCPIYNYPIYYNPRHGIPLMDIIISHIASRKVN